MKLKGIDGAQHKRWSMWFNSIQSEEPYQGLTADDKSIEGEDDVKSSCPLCLGRHTCYNGWDKGSQSRKSELTPKTRPQFGLQAATRQHESEIASNRWSAIRQ
ncbi:hypothetical protein M9H77_17200 [Catharanthus roseus]|uniref:Uncharacterized protein n=1 Tax=Catharanthus roseus TaxID=4058 RepID=A0ACC0B3X7_CATRO|nr:hypothetical protein M9H77_17200 [Catharanthus roseus]